jgi:hypothetical protein
MISGATHVNFHNFFSFFHPYDRSNFFEQNNRIKKYRELYPRILSKTPKNNLFLVCNVFSNLVKDFAIDAHLHTIKRVGRVRRRETRENNQIAVFLDFSQKPIHIRV